MKTYDVWFQDGHIMFTVLARNNGEARKVANSMISIKEQEYGNKQDGEKE